MNEIKKRLRKLLALSRRGEKHEAASAGELLANLLAKYNLVLEDIAKEDLSLEWYAYKDKDEEIILTQIICRALGVTEFKCGVVGKKLRIEATALQHIQIAEEREIYLSEFRKERKALLHAFIIKNDIYSSSDESEETSKKSDEEHLERVAQLFNGINKVILQKSISEGEHV